MNGFGFNTFSLPAILLGAVAVILVIIAKWRIFEKAGQPGWGSIIPYIDFFFILKIVNKPLWWIIWLFVPLANVVVGIWVTNLLAKSFGKNEGFTLGLIFLPFIFYPILGFGNASFQGPVKQEKTFIQV
jgi:ABC-type sulfate transport system permease subunit